MSSYYRHPHQSSSSLNPGEAHIETAAALHEYQEDEEEGSGREPVAGGTVYSLPPLTSYDEDGSSSPDACIAAASLSPSQVRSMASAIARGRNEGTSIVRSKRRMKENTDNSTCSIDSQLEHNSLLNRSFRHRDLLLEANARDCYENIAVKCRVKDGDCQRPLVRNVFEDGNYIDGGCFEGYNVSYGKNSRGEQNAGFCQVVNQLSIGLDRSKNKKSKTDKKCALPINYEQGNNLLEYSPGALRGMANPTDPEKLLCVSKQDMMNPNGVVLHSGMKLEEFIKMLVNSLRAGDESQVTFVGREIYLLKSLKPSIGQSEVEMHNLALNKIKNAILYYVTNYVDEKYAVRVFYALYSISQFFANVTRCPSDGGTEDAECIIKALLLLRKCPTKNIAMDVEQAFGTNNGKRKGRVSESELLSALEKCDVKLIRFLVAKLCCCLHDGGDFATIDVESESFPEPHCSMKNTDVYDSEVVREKFDFANILWKQLLNLALETDKKIKDTADNPFVCLGVNVIGVSMDALRVFYNGTFYTSNTTSKLSILSSACVFLAYARSQLVTASPPVLFLEADIRDTVDVVLDDVFDYERDHCYIPTSERYETTGLVSFDEVYTPRSSAVTYVPHQEFPSLVQKVSGTCPKQIEYYKYLTRLDADDNDDDDSPKKPCTPATALYATALKIASTNYTERINNLAAATINPIIENQQLGCTMDNLSEEDTGRLNVNISEERYLLSTDEDMIKRFRTTSVNDKYGLDKSFMYAVKRLLGVSTPAGRYGLNLIDAKVLWPVQNSDVKEDEMNGPSKRHRIAFESGVIGPHSTLDSEDPMVVADTTAEANWNYFKEYLSAKAANKMRFLSLIILRAIMGVGKRLERSDIHLCLGEDKRIFYVTIDNEERVGMKKCEDVLEDSAEFISLCTPVTVEDMQFLPPWCAGLFDGDCDIMEVEKRPRKNSEQAAALPAASNSDDDELVETTDRFKKAFKYSDLTRYFHEMALEHLEEGNADGSLVKKMISRNMKAARNAEHDKTLADANSRLKAAYGAAVQDKYLYDESSRGDIYSEEYDSDEDICNPFIPEGENAFFHVAIPQDTEYAQSNDDNEDFLPTLMPAEKLRQEYFRYCTYNLNCKSGGKVSLPSSDDECQRGDNILISRKMILNDIKMSISEAARTSSFVFFDRCMRRIYRNLNRITRAADFLHEGI